MIGATGDRDGLHPHRHAARPGGIIAPGHNRPHIGRRRWQRGGGWGGGVGLGGRGRGASLGKGSVPLLAIAVVAPRNADKCSITGSIVWQSQT